MRVEMKGLPPKTVRPSDPIQLMSDDALQSSRSEARASGNIGIPLARKSSLAEVGKALDRRREHGRQDTPIIYCPCIRWMISASDPRTFITDL